MDLVVEVAVEVVLVMGQQRVKSWQLFQPLLELGVARLLRHPKPCPLEMALYLRLYCNVLLPHLAHEKLKYLVGRCARLVHHVHQSLVASAVLQYELFPFGLVPQLSRSELFSEHIPEGTAIGPVLESFFLGHELVVLFFCL